MSFTRAMKLRPAGEPGIDIALQRRESAASDWRSPVSVARSSLSVERHLPGYAGEASEVCAGASAPGVKRPGDRVASGGRSGYGVACQS
jgi:hypothetical protein